jgi:Uma2 family endonuclease
MFPNVSTPALFTAADVAGVSLPGKSVELVRGHLVVREPPGTRHGRVSAELTYQIMSFVKRERLGAVFAQDTGFQIAADPDTVRGPDVAFVSRDRLAQIPRTGYAALAPDLVAEVLSPGDRPGEVLAKVADWLSAGARLVWVIDPERVEARVYRPDGSLSIVNGDASLDGEDVLPGFRVLLGEILK